MTIKNYSLLLFVLFLISGELSNDCIAQKLEQFDSVNLKMFGYHYGKKTLDLTIEVTNDSLFIVDVENKKRVQIEQEIHLDSLKSYEFGLSELDDCDNGKWQIFFSELQNQKFKLWNALVNPIYLSLFRSI